MMTYLSQQRTIAAELEQLRAEALDQQATIERLTGQLASARACDSVVCPFEEDAKRHERNWKDLRTFVKKAGLTMVDGAMRRLEARPK